MEGELRGKENQGERALRGRWRIPDGFRLKFSEGEKVSLLSYSSRITDVEHCRRSPKVEYWVQLLRRRYAGMNLIVGRDKVDKFRWVLAISTCMNL
ncbi:hypothetical protein EV401DRAFT_1359216 [Pisolithus croceorrhizus]|nr:hypothetical protein EV401DRAFT_1359216 [Pisolithus croceorrhizus]